MAPVSLNESTLGLIEEGRRVAALDPSAYERAAGVVNSIYPDEFPYYILGIASGIATEVEAVAKTAYDLGIGVGQIKGVVTLMGKVAELRKESV